MDNSGGTSIMNKPELKSNTTHLFIVTHMFIVNCFKNGLQASKNNIV